MRLEVGWLCEQRETHHLCRGPSHWANYFLPPINLPSGEKQKIQDRPCTLQLKLGGSLIWFEILWAHVEGQHLEQGHNKRHTEAVISPLQDCFFIHEVTLPDLLNMTLFFLPPWQWPCKDPNRRSKWDGVYLKNSGTDSKMFGAVN